MSKDYSATITEISFEASKKERVMIKDVSAANKLDLFVSTEPLEIEVAGYAKVHIINENSDDKEYDNMVVVTTDGERYVTGSPSFERAFIEIFEEMGASTPDEPWKLKVYKRPSKKREGQEFITCTVI